MPQDATPSDNLIPVDGVDFGLPASQKLYKIEVEGGRLIYRQSQGGTWELVDIFVQESYRRRGVGTRLVDQMRREVTGTIYLFSRRTNTEARAFYRRLGFAETIIPNLYGGNDDGSLYRDTKGSSMLSDLITRLRGESYADHLNTLLRMIQQKSQHPFAYLRFNDGEFNAMSRRYSPEDVNSDHHRYFPDMGESIVRVFREMRDSDLSNVQVGSYWFTDPRHHSAVPFLRFAQREEIVEKIHWVGGDELILGLPSGQTVAILDAIREQAKELLVVLVCNDRIADARNCLGAMTVTIPQTDCWLATRSIMQECEELAVHAAKGSLFVWCAGMPASVWAWDLWKKYPATSHLNAGHLFDGVFGVLSRQWMVRGDGDEDNPTRGRWRYYRDVFTPYVKRFIPG